MQVSIKKKIIHHAKNQEDLKQNEKKKKKKTNRCQYQDELLELSKIFKAAMIKMLRWAIKNMHETNEN